MVLECMLLKFVYTLLYDFNKVDVENEINTSEFKLRILVLNY